MRVAAGITLLLLISGIALPVHSQDDSSSEPIRWPYFESEFLIAPPSQEVRGFGHEVATDGERILIASDDNAFIYTREKGKWNLEKTLNPELESVSSVSLSNGIAAVGGSGSVLTWTLKGATWSQGAELEKGDAFGHNVLIGDNHLFVSSPSIDPVLGASQAGSVAVYAIRSQSLHLTQTIDEPTPAGQRVFGADLAMRGDTLVIGAPARPVLEQAAPGSAMIYERQGGKWALKSHVQASPGIDAESSFGYEVATTGGAVIVSASPSYLGTGGDQSGSGWVAVYEPDSSGNWQLIQEERSDGTALAARDNAFLVVDYWWNAVGVYYRETSQLRCWNHGWCEVGFLGGWEAFGNDSPIPDAMALEGRVAVLGAPTETFLDDPTGLVLAYYDNAKPRARALPDAPVDDVDEDGKEAFTLDGSNSFDIDGTIEKFEWFEDGVSIGTEPFIDMERPLGVHSFKLEVTDDLGAVGIANIDVLVRPPQLGVEINHCCGWFSGIDPGRNVYFWSSVDEHRSGVKHWDWDFDGDGKTDNTEVSPRYSFPHGGTWPVHLTVTNEDGDTLHAYKDIVINNAAPVALAGEPQVVVVDATGIGTVTLDASDSYDADGSITSYNWMRQDPVAGSYSTTATTKTADVQVAQGVNKFILRVTDDDSDTSQVDHTVIAISQGQNMTGVPPTADMAASQGVRSVVLQDKSKPGDAEIVAWSWGLKPDALVEGPDRMRLTFEDAGKQPVYMTVYDADGRTSLRTMHIDVEDNPPELYAWPLYGTVPVDTYGVFLSYVRDEAPDRLQWEWRINGELYSDHQDVGHTFDSIGNHSVSVKVTDDTGKSVEKSGWIEVLTEEEFRQAFGDSNETEEDPEGINLFEGNFEAPDAAIQEDLDKQREVERQKDPISDDSTDSDLASGPLVAAKAPATPSAGGLAATSWVWIGIALLLVLLVVVEGRRQWKRRQERRRRYEASMKARIMRHHPPVEFRDSKR